MQANNEVAAWRPARHDQITGHEPTETGEKQPRVIVPGM
jgi:hypothetical protein